MQFARKRRKQPFINIISLIDILVVLLIFYIATTVFKHATPKIKVDVPKTTAANTTPEELPATIYVTADSKVYLDDAPVNPKELGNLLKQKVAANPNYKVAMKGDKNAPLQILVQVWAAASDAKISSLPTYVDVKAQGASNP